MTRVRTLLLATLAATAIVVAGCGDDPPGTAAVPGADAAADTTPTPPGARGPSVLRAPIRLLNGDTLPASRLAGRVVLVVNTASRCGFTPQFEGLEALYRSRDDLGLEVVGFPANDFNQELGSGEEIGRFCSLNYGVSFPMAAKSRVTGAKANALFAAIAARPGPAGEEPGWNFTKYLLDRHGRLAARFDSSVEPDDPALVAAVDRLLDEGDL